jgi:hypothetical protein
MSNLLVEVSHIRAHNIVLFNEVLKRTACNEFGNLKKVIQQNFSEIQPEELSQFVIEKLEEGDIFIFKKFENWRIQIVIRNRQRSQERGIIIQFIAK